MLYIRSLFAYFQRADLPAYHWGKCRLVRIQIQGGDNARQAKRLNYHYIPKGKLHFPNIRNAEDTRPEQSWYMLILRQPGGGQGQWIDPEISLR